jgi:Ca2+-binding EF-hand superfamily protein
MKKMLALAGLLCLTLNSVQLAAQADDWFGKYDLNHDNHWSYNEFSKANNDWAGRHTEEKRLSDAELRTQFNGWDTDHHGWVTRDNVEHYHTW